MSREMEYEVENTAARMDASAEGIVKVETGDGMWSKLLLVAVAGCGLVFLLMYVFGGPSPNTEYSAVRLSNGETYYGKLSGLGSKFPVMTDVFTIAEKLVPGTSEIGPVMTPRQNEFHNPRRTILNAEQIVFVESVAAGSPVGQLIKRSKR